MDAIRVNEDKESLTKDQAKVIAIFILGLGSIIFGLIPAWFRRSRQRFPLVITILLCFGAGVLLATSIVHMLSEVKEDLPKYAEIVFCIGFFIVYTTDELVHYFFGEAIQHTHGANGVETAPNHNHTHDHNPTQRRSRTSVTQYGTDQETQSLLVKTDEDAASTHSEAPPNCADDGAANARICHTSHTEPCEQSFIGVTGLLCALSLHSFIEGIAIGVQDTGTKVTILLIAVSSHKFVVAFCLGIELCANASSRLKTHISAILVFSLGSVLGIVVGIFLVDSQQLLSQTTIPVLQGLAGGTLLYVTVCEVLPREKARWHQSPDNKCAGLVQLLAVAVGFTTMTLMNEFLAA